MSQATPTSHANLMRASRGRIPALLAALLLTGAAGCASEPAATVSAGRQTPAPTAPTSQQAAAVTEDPEPLLAIVPAFRRSSLDEARSAARREGLKVEVAREPSWEAVGTVLAQDLAQGSEVEPGSVLVLTVAAPMPLIPTVAGMAEAEAVAAVKRAGFKVRVVNESVTSGVNGVALRREPSTLRAEPGSVVTVVVAKVIRTVTQTAPSNCTAGYSPCLPPASDYDCAGGSGDGPEYAVGPIQVTGSDPYDLDSEGDGIACETY